MAAPLTNITNRLTPSTPIEITFGATPVQPGTKYATLFGHKAASGDTAPDYYAYNVINLGDPVAALAEVNALAGAGSQIGNMAAAFINANAATGNYPAFRVVLLPYSELHFGPSSQAIASVSFLRSDFLVSCYPAGDSVNRATLLALAVQISGPDRDLMGQYGTFCIFGSLDSKTVQEAYAINSQYALVAGLPDSNTAQVTELGDVALSSNTIINIASTAGIYPGAAVTGAGIPAGTIVQQVNKTSVVISANATATATQESIVFQNAVSQPVEIVAAAFCAGRMALGYPYYPSQGVTIGGLIPPQVPSDRIAYDPNGDSEALLKAGISPLYVQPGNTVGFIRTRTTLTLKSDGVTAVTDYFDYEQLAVLNDFRESCYEISQNPPFNNNPGGTKASAQIAALLKDEILREAKSFEADGAFQNVTQLAPQFLVQVSTTSLGRFDFKIPVDAVPGLYVIAGNIVGVDSTNLLTL